MSSISSDSALRALHLVLIQTRAQAFQGCDSQTIAQVMDSAEYLVAILRNSPGLTEEETLADFRMHLQDIEARFSGYTNLVAAFDESQQDIPKKQLVATNT